MMSQGETGKQRSQRIDLDYYRYRDGLHQLKWVAVAAGLIGALGYAAYALTESGQRQLSTGVISASHASFENDCRKCHRDFTPIASDAFRLDQSASLEHLESACQQCHRVGDHYREVLNADAKAIDQNCAHCHREHEGRMQNLTAIGNDRCTLCHSKLPHFCNAPHKLSVAESITEFTSSGHGDFQSLLAKDPGKIKFDHHQHMLPGQVESDQRGEMSILMLSPADRPRYRKSDQKDSDAVTLVCTDCHKFAGNPDDQFAHISDDELGRYMAPISFDQHCAACHAMNTPGRDEQTLPLPHAAPWTEISLLLKAKMLGARNAAAEALSRESGTVTPQPGTGFAMATPSQPISDAVIESALSEVATQCLKCHDQADISDHAIEMARSGQSPPLIPARWLRHGLYDHAAHRQIDCRYCHGAAYPPEPGSATGQTSAAGHPPTDQQHVMIAGIARCTDCHRDPGTPTPESLAQAKSDRLLGDLFGDQSTWASDACILCHRYHTNHPGTNPSGPNPLALGETVP